MKKNYNDCLIVNRKDMVQHSKACLYARDVLIAHIAAQIGLFRNNLKTDMLQINNNFVVGVNFGFIYCVITLNNE